MFKNNKLWLFIAIALGVELLIYMWAVCTASLNSSNFFAIEPEFIFDKCARNSGRVSAAINLGILLMIGYYGLKQIYLNKTNKNLFRNLITVFAVNHLTHFFFVYQNFKHHTLDLTIADNTHGFVTFMCVLIVPLILWLVKDLNWFLYLCITVHLFNVSYFIMETFYNKIKPDKPAYHNQFGIYITIVACFYILYRVFREYFPNAGRLNTKE